MDEKKDEIKPRIIGVKRIEAPYKPHIAAVPYGSVDPDLVDKGSLRRISLYELIYAILGLLLGFACIVGGILLFFHGVTGSSSWTAKFMRAESKLSDAAPGVVLFVVGGLIVFVTRFRFIAHRSKEAKNNKVIIPFCLSRRADHVTWASPKSKSLPFTQTSDAV